MSLLINMWRWLRDLLGRFIETDRNLFFDLALDIEIDFLSDNYEIRRVQKCLYRVIDTAEDGSIESAVAKLVRDALDYTESLATAERLSFSDINVGVQVLFLAAEVCQSYSIQDPNQFRKILDRECEIVSVAPGFQSTMYDLPAWFTCLRYAYNPRPCVLYPEKQSHLDDLQQIFNAHIRISKETLAAMEYYVTQATLARKVTLADYILTEEDFVLLQEYRFVDTPIHLDNQVFSTPLARAYVIGEPQATLLLLRCGASPVLRSRELDRHQVGFLREPLIELMTSLRLLEEIERFSYFDTPDLMAFYYRKQDQFKACLLITLRAIPMARIKFYRQPMGPFHRDWVVFQGKSVLLYMPELYNSIVPKHCLWGSPPLRHLCRCVIRHSLRTAYQLPDGINQFDIPSTLKEYLDLRCD